MPNATTQSELPAADVGRMFDRTAARYDLLNTLLSWGRDDAWRRALAAPIGIGERVLDLCCGSGRSVVPAYRRSGRTVVGVDLSGPMLAHGATYARRTACRFGAVQADALQLPFPGEIFDVVTVAWGLRNLRPEAQALSEIRRVLRSGGKLLVLDSPSPEPGVLGALHGLYLRTAVPLLGRLSSDPEAYRYLARTVLAYGRRGEVAERLAQAGFRVAGMRTLFFGAATIWAAGKPRATTGPGTVQDARIGQEAIAR